MDELQKYNIGDQIWVMQDNKPTCYYVWEIKREEMLWHQSDYGQAYGHKTLIKYDYLFRDHKDNSYKSRDFWLSQMDRPYFPTKEELLNSL